MVIATRDATIDPRQVIVRQHHTPEEVQQVCRRLQAMCQMNATLGTTTDLPAMMATLIDCLLDLYPGAERAFVLLSASGSTELVPLAAKTRRETQMQQDEPALSRTIVQTVKNQKCAILSHDVLADPRFKAQDSVIAHGIRSLMCAPILVDDEFFGLIQLDTRSVVQPFTSDDLEVLTAVSAQAVLAIKQVQLIVQLRTANATLRHEIAQRQEAETALRESEQHFRSLAAAAPVGVFRTDVDGQYFYVNELWSTITGLTSPDAYNVDWTRSVHPEDREHIRRIWTQAVQSQAQFQAEYRFQHTDGTIRWVYGQAVAEKTENGAICGYVGTITDITARKQAEAERERLQQQLIDSSRQAGMAELATGVLHNVGNVLNSVNVAARLLSDQLKHSAIPRLAQASALLQDHASDLGAFLTTHAQGQHFPRFFHQLAHKLEAERVAWLEEVEGLMHNVEHIKEIVSLQQSYARVSGMRERLDLLTLLEDALKTLDVSALQANFSVVREVQAVPPLLTDKHKVLQILVNLISNAKHALLMANPMQPRLTLRLVQPRPACVAVEVSDNGVGIEREHLTRIFAYGFTTKPNGHGFGLHSSALAAKELGGTLTASSEGPGCGATFRLELPLQTEGKNTCVKAIIVDNDVS
jgi:PAS domain S-box-containing protein